MPTQIHVTCAWLLLGVHGKPQIKHVAAFPKLICSFKASPLKATKHWGQESYHGSGNGYTINSPTIIDV